MTKPLTVAVIDIGKTNAKVVLFDFAKAKEIWTRKLANTPVRSGPYPHHDVEKLWAFILESLKAAGADHEIDAISITTHGATGVLLDDKYELALPALDYEFTGLNVAEYDKVRPGFDETGSPRLPGGLNLGAQYYWLQSAFPKEFAKARWIVMYPQYFAYRLSGVLAGEVTSLGCHTDLWAPEKEDYSSMVDKLGWRKMMPPIRKAADELGHITKDVAKATGLPLTTPVMCGIHDSNASLYPHLFSQHLPFSVVSTGTWVINMAMGGKKVELDAARDTLINVNALGHAVPTSRFMGGREFQMLMEGHEACVTTSENAERVLEDGAMLLPSVVESCGPFPSRKAQWIKAEKATPGERRAIVSYYLALMTSVCLNLIGAQGPVLVEGPFASNAQFVAMLSAATGRDVLLGEAEATGTSLGAALLATPEPMKQAPSQRVNTAADSLLSGYAAQWKKLVAQKS